MAIRWKLNQERTAEAMLRKGYDLKALAREIPEYSYRSVQAAVHGDTAPRPSLIAAIANALQVDPVSLCDKVEGPETRGRRKKSTSPELAEIDPNEIPF